MAHIFDCFSLTPQDHEVSLPSLNCGEFVHLAYEYAQLMLPRNHLVNQTWNKYFVRKTSQHKASTLVDNSYKSSN